MCFSCFKSTSKTKDPDPTPPNVPVDPGAAAIALQDRIANAATAKMLHDAGAQAQASRSGGLNRQWAEASQAGGSAAAGGGGGGGGY